MNNLYLRTPLRKTELENVQRFPANLVAANRRFLSWRLLCRNDFVKRLQPRAVSYVAHRLGTSPAKARLLCQWHGWECLPRKAASDQQLWVPPITEQFAETDF